MRLSYDYHRERARFKKKRLSYAKPQKAAIPQKQARKKRFSIKALISAAVVLVILGVFAFVALIGWFSRDLPNPNRLIERALPQSTKIYDRTGDVLLFQFHGDQQRTLVTLNEIPDMLKKATVVAEDRSFYQHRGFDMKGIVRALVMDVVRGGKVQGGSTITQQLIKNALLSNEKTIARKFKELILAYRIEQSFTKDQILQLYLNEIPYGSTAYGVSAAAGMYFDKDVRRLNLAESAVLAVLPKAPTYYSPWGNNRDKLIARQRAVIDQMAEEGYITEEEARLAKEEKLAFRSQANSIRAPHFVMMVREQLSSLFGDKLVEEGGLSVITTLDYEKQKVAEEEVREGAARNAKQNASNAALVSLDARTGDILALVGSKDYFDESVDGNVNVVLRPRQPGSSFKPIVYAAALQKGYTPSTIIFDLKTDFDTTGEKPYTPQNYTNKEYGPVTLKKALAGSLNIAAVKVLYLAGLPAVLGLAENLGYSTLRDPSRFGLSLVLGGGEVMLLEHVAAYTALAQDGVRAQPIAILSVRDSKGALLHEAQHKQTKTSLEPETTRNITDMISDNGAREYIFGKQNYLTLSGREVAVKTGTTNDFRDAWTVGYTPSIVTGVWVGNNDNSSMNKRSDGSAVAAPIWNGYMRRTLARDASESFTRPLPITTGKGILDGQMGQEMIVRVDRRTGLPATGNPFEEIEERASRVIHDTLFYVNKDDPRGAIPQHPEQDAQFSRWEQSVRAWVKRENIKESTDVLVQEKTSPIQDVGDLALTIESPHENDTITEPLLHVTVATSSSDGIVSVAYYLDTKPLGVLTQAPFELFSTLRGVDNGFRTLRVVSTDTKGRAREASMTLNILLQ